jgi:hypothetical protein
VCLVLLDEQFTGNLAHFRSLANSPIWQSLTHGIGLSFTNFPEQGLAQGISDRDVWLFCQARGIFLLTDNRNRRGPDSLEEVLQTLNTPDSYPVFTIGNRDRLARNRDYAERVIERLLERLLDADNLRGVGRLYLP